MSKRRSFTREKKLENLRYAEDHGTVATCRQYELSQGLFYRWKHAFDQSGMDGLEPAYHRIDPQVRELELENARLGKIIAKQALELEVKGELIKKTTRYNDAKDGHHEVQRYDTCKVALQLDWNAQEYLVLLPLGRNAWDKTINAHCSL